MTATVASGFRALLSSAGRAYLKAFGAALLIYAPGVLAAPNLNQQIAVGVAALMASVAAGVTAIQVFVPQLSIATYLPGLLGEVLDAFLQGFVGSFLITLTGWLHSPDLSTWRSAAAAALTGAATAGLRAIQGKLSGEPAAPPKVAHRARR